MKRLTKLSSAPVEGPLAARGSLGYLDDLLIVPLGILAVVKLIPPEVVAEHRAAAALTSERPTSRVAATVIILTWVASIGVVTWWGYRYFAG